MALQFLPLCRQRLSAKLHCCQYLILVLAVFFQESFCETQCIKDSVCKCTLDDGSKRFFDFSDISRADEAFFQVGTPGNVDYYDPCQPFTVEESGGVCDGVAACHAEVAEETNYSKVALHSRVVFNYNEAGENVNVNYDNGKYYTGTCAF